ncbi:hypothetical protein TELCIR_02465 [Teladorsagia circumcincta]|uniref:Uncharacterized protein n=1 Tax=Teladorsagia circumcincta TaxID=45464 RepID=A0A2G9UZ02_TELCI|nr:hypothetical protein TELCIR_02465 [Teladorsagia circumcincta]
MAQESLATGCQSGARVDGVNPAVVLREQASNGDSNAGITTDKKPKWCSPRVRSQDGAEPFHGTGVAEDDDNGDDSAVKFEFIGLMVQLRGAREFPDDR